VSRTSGYVQPALLGGLVAGVLSALPVVSAGNLCCCLWVVTGGLTASYLLQQNRDAPITTGDGATVGLLSGVVGAVVQFVLSIPIGLIIGPIEREMLRRFGDVWGSIGGAGDLLGGYGGQDAGMLGFIVVTVIGFFVSLIVGSMVSTVAGVIGAAMFAKKTGPPHSADG
jgi:hypothetical protein